MEIVVRLFFAVGAVVVILSVAALAILFIKAAGDFWYGWRRKKAQ